MSQSIYGKTGFYAVSSVCSAVCIPQYSQWESIRAYPDPINTEEDRKKALKAEATAQQLIQDVIGLDEWKIYKDSRIIATRGQYTWLIGNVFNSYHEDNPFVGKPDVVRIDNLGLWAKLRGWTGQGIPVTAFCVNPVTRDEMPYSDKVLAYVMQCANDEKGFRRMANRIGERSLDSFPVCAMYDPTKG